MFSDRLLPPLFAGIKYGIEFVESTSWFKKAVIFLVLISGLRLMLLATDDLDLFFEEAQYWLWSKRPALSYYTKPPMVAWVNLLTTSAFGDHEWVIKCNAILMGFFTSLVYFHLTRVLFKDGKQAFYVAITLNIFPFFIIPSSYFTTDSLLILFWGTSTLIFQYALEKDQKYLWVLLGVSCGLGFLSKYTMIFFLPYALLYLYLTDKKKLTNGRLYLALAIATLVISPDIIWNIQHDFVAFSHLTKMGGLANTSSFFGNPKYILEYLGGQTGAFAVLPFFTCIIAMIWSYRKKIEQVFFLVLGPIIVFVSFFLLSLHDKVEMNWTFFVYPPLVIVIVHYWSKKNEAPTHTLTVGTSLLIVILYLFPQILDSVFGKAVIPVKVDVNKRLAGWNYLGKLVDKKIKGLDDQAFFVFTSDYQVASQVTFYAKGVHYENIHTVDIGQRGNQFNLWPGLDQYKNQSHLGIYVSKDPMPESLTNSFEDVISVDHFQLSYRGQRNRKFYIYVLAGLKDLNFKE